jgi:hypothetical protein
MFAAAISATPLLVELAAAAVIAAALLARRPLRRQLAALRRPVRREPAQARVRRV